MNERMNILIVEDDKGDIRRIKRSVSRVVDGFSELENPNFVEINKVESEDIKKLTELDFDIAIVDYELLEDSNGFEAIKYLRTRDLFFETKVIVWTGKAKDIDDAKTVINKYKVFSYLTKGQQNDFDEQLKEAILSIKRDRKIKTLSSFSDINFRRFIEDDKKWKSLESGLLCEKAIMFCDLSNSTDFIQEMRRGGQEQSGAAKFLRNFFTEASKIIKKYGGIIDKFIGDEVMAYFGGFQEEEEPLKLCYNALCAAWEIKITFAGWFEKEMEKPGYNVIPAIKPDVKTIVHFGEVIWGVIGSEDFLDVSILTHQVIKAVRLLEHSEGGKKLVNGGEILITKDVYDCLLDYIKERKIHFSEKIVVENVRNFGENSIPVYKVKNVKICLS